MSVKVKRGDPIEVEWTDACSYGGWHVPTDYNLDPLKVRSCGYLLKQTKKALSMIQSKSEYGKTSELLIIPNGMLLNVRKLR